MNTRKQQAEQMLKRERGTMMTDFGKYKVLSQTKDDVWYDVIQTGHGLICTCLDHIFSHSDCKHIHVIKGRIMEGRFGKQFRLMNRDNLKLCKYCDSGKIIKKGFRKTKKGDIQVFKCQECDRRFTNNLGFKIWYSMIK